VSSDRRSQGGGLSITTLVIAGAASAAAAFIVPMFWQRGTVFAAAMTPIIVSVVSELLQRPVEAASAVRVRRTAGGTALLDPVEPPPERDEPFDPLAPAPTEELEAALASPEALPARTVERRRRALTGRQWRLALITGLIAFAGVVAVVTISELAVGDSVSKGGGHTTFFGGSDSKKATPTPTATPTETATPEESATPEATETPTPTPTASPTPTVSPERLAPGATASPAPTPTPTPTP
jgi:hypothetical protein